MALIGKEFMSCLMVFSNRHLFGRATHEAYQAPRAIGVAESGPHSSLGDRQARLPGEERANLRACAKFREGWRLQKKAHLQRRCAFFNEIRLQRVKFGNAQVK